MAMQDLTTGSIRGRLLRMGAFMLMGMMVQSLYSMIDLYWVGRLGAQAVAAVSLSSNLMLIVMAISMMLSMGTGALVSQAFGRNDRETVRSLFNQAMLASGLLSVIFLVGFVALRRYYVDALAGDAETARLSYEFLLYFTPALAAQFPLMSLYSAMRGTGDIRTSAVAQISTVVLNIIMAPFLIFGWGTGHPLGVAGASLSTLLALVIGSSGLLFRILSRGGYFAKGPGAWRPRYALWFSIVRIGSPSAADLGLMAIYASIVMGFLQRFGAVDQAAFGIGLRLLQVGLMPLMAMGVALTAVVGQNFGAGQGARVREAFYFGSKANLGAAVLFAIAFSLAPEALIRPFSHDPAVIAAGAEYLRISAWSLLSIGPVMACWGIFGGLGYTMPSLLGSIVRTGSVLIPTALLSRLADFQPRWIWLLNVAATVLQLILNFWFARRELRRKIAPIEHPRAEFGSERAESGDLMQN